MRILIVEQKKKFAQMVKHLLEKEDYEVDILQDCPMVSDYLKLEIYDLMILHMALPDHCCRLIRTLRKEHFSLPILVLTEQATVAERIESLNAGADYYLEIAYEPQELLACIRALLRRTGAQLNELCFADTSLDLSSATLLCKQRQIRLTAKEFQLMRLLLQNPNHNLSKEQILSYVWGYESNATENHVEVYIRFLRKKLLQINSGISIVSIRRLGYHLEATASSDIS